MEVLKTFGAGLVFLATIYILSFIASMGWHQAEAIVQFIIDIRLGNFD